MAWGTGGQIDKAKIPIFEQPKDNEKYGEGYMRHFLR